MTELRRVLLIEPSPERRADVERAFAAQGLAVASVTSADAAFEAFAASSFHIVVLGSGIGTGLN